MGQRLTNWTARQKLSAAHLNEAWNLLRTIAGVVGYDLNQVGEDARENFLPSVKFGEVVDEGPNGEADGTDERYWVVEMGIQAGDNQDSTIVPIDLQPQTFTNPVDGSDVTIPVIYTVTNVLEVYTHTHTLTVGTPVLFFELFDRADPTPNIRRVMLAVAAVTIDIYSGTTLFQADVASLALAATLNTNGIFEWAAGTLGSDPNGISLRFKSGATARQVLQMGSGGTIIWDYMRTY